MWTHVDEVVGLAHDGFIMLDDDESVPLVAERVHHLDEAVDVAVVQSHRGLIQNEESVSECGAEAGGEIDAGDFSATECPGGSIESEVAEAHFVEVF